MLFLYFNVILVSSVMILYSTFDTYFRLLTLTDLAQTVPPRGCRCDSPEVFERVVDLVLMRTREPCGSSDYDRGWDQKG